MKHLTDTEFVDSLESELQPRRQEHLDTCAACRARIEELRIVLRTLRTVDVPEPSPLYWNHFSARLRESLDVPAASAAKWLPQMRLLQTAAVLAVLLASAALWLAPWRGNGVPGPGAPNARSLRVGVGEVVGRPGVEVAPPEDDLDEPSADDESWAVVRKAAGSVEWDDAREAGLMLEPGSAERQVLRLTEAERAELERLIDEELKRAGA